MSVSHLRGGGTTPTKFHSSGWSLDRESEGDGIRTQCQGFFQSPYRYRLWAAVQSNKVYLARLALCVFISIAGRAI